MKRFHVGARILKTTLAVIIAILIAQQVGLEGTVGLAALVALVTVQKSFQLSLVQSAAALGSVLLGGLLGMTFGYLFGVTPLAYGLVTLAGISLSCHFKMPQQSVLTTMMGIGTIFSGAGNLGVYALLQVLTATTGGASALGINYLFNPNYHRELNLKLQQVEEETRETVDFVTTALQERGGRSKEFRDQIYRAKKSIQEAWDVIWLLGEDQRRTFATNRRKDFSRQYQTLEILNNQLYRLEVMHRMAQRLPVEIPQAKRLIKLLRIIQRIQYNAIRGKKKEYARVDYAMENLDRLFTSLELPCPRNEFVTRASLFHMLEEVKNYYRDTLKLPVTAVDLDKEAHVKEESGIFNLARKTLSQLKTASLKIFRFRLRHKPTG